MIGAVLPQENSQTVEPRPVRTWILWLSTVLVMLSLIIYVSIVVAVPSFSELFAGFGAALPLLTSIVLDYSQYAIVLALVGIIPLVSMWRNRLSGGTEESRNFRRVVASFGISLIVAGVSMTGVYLPIFKLGVAVS